MTDSRGYLLHADGEVGGNIGGDYRLFFKSAPFAYKGKTVRLNHTVYLAAPLTFRIDVDVSEGTGPFLHMSPWRFRKHRHRWHPWHLRHPSSTLFPWRGLVDRIGDRFEPFHIALVDCQLLHILSPARRRANARRRPWCTTAPRPISSSGPLRSCVRPRPSSTISNWPLEWLCQFDRLPAGNFKRSVRIALASSCVGLPPTKLLCCARGAGRSDDDAGRDDEVRTQARIYSWPSPACLAARFPCARPGREAGILARHAGSDLAAPWCADSWPALVYRARGRVGRPPRRLPARRCTARRAPRVTVLTARA